jgi:hypothetical protein
MLNVWTIPQPSRLIELPVADQRRRDPIPRAITVQISLPRWAHGTSEPATRIRLRGRCSRDTTSHGIALVIPVRKSKRVSSPRVAAHLPFATNAHAAGCLSLLRIGDRGVSRMSRSCKHESSHDGLDGSVAP